MVDLDAVCSLSIILISLILHFLLLSKYNEITQDQLKKRTVHT